MFGLEESEPARKSLKLFQENNINNIAELGEVSEEIVFFSLKIIFQ